MVRQTVNFFGKFRSKDFSRIIVSGPKFSSWFKPDGNYCFLILDGHYQGSWTQSDLTRRWFSTLIAILRNHHFSRKSRWPENDQFSSKITENEKLFIYAHRDLMHIIIHHWTLKLCRIFENFQKYYIIGWLKNYVKIYTKKFIFNICNKKKFYCSLYDGGGIVGGPVGPDAPVVPGPGRPV